MGGYYDISNDNLAELKYFIDEDNISEKLINRESIKAVSYTHLVSLCIILMSGVLFIT